MLAHLQRDDRVVRAVADVAVVLQPDVDPVGEPLVGRALRGERLLLARERDAGDVHAVVLGGVQRQRAPAAADVEQPLAGLQAELAADQIELVALRVGERVVRGVARPVGAGVRHPRVEHERVEVVGQVVVVGDRRAVAQLGVQPAAQLRLRRRRRQPAADDPELRRRCVRPCASSRGAHAGCPVRPRSRTVAQTLSSAVCRSPSTSSSPVTYACARPSSPGRPEQPAQRGGGAQDRRGRAGRAGLAAVPGAQPERQLAAEERRDQRRELRRDPRWRQPGAARGSRPLGEQCHGVPTW